MTDAAEPILDQPAIGAWLQRRIADLLEIDPTLVDPLQPFESYGMASSDAVFLSGDLSDFLGMRVSATVAWEVATIDELAALLAAVLRGEVELPDDQFEWDLDADLLDPG